MEHHTISGPQWLLIQVASWAALFNSFVIFEETVIDRSAWREMIPGYRPGSPCVWDLIAAVVFAVIVILVFRRKGVGE